MKNSKTVLNVTLFGLVAILLAAAIALNLTVPSAAQADLDAWAQTNRNLDPGRVRAQSMPAQGNSYFQNDVTAPGAGSAQLPNGAMVALVMQPQQEKIHAFNALNGQWVTLEGPDFKVEGDDVAYVGNLVALVAQNGQDQLHAFSALTGAWSTLSGDGFRVSSGDIFKVKDSLILVSQPAAEQLHAFSALTGEWATLSGEGFNVSPDDILLVGGEDSGGADTGLEIETTQTSNPTGGASESPVSEEGAAFEITQTLSLTSTTPVSSTSD